MHQLHWCMTSQVTCAEGSKVQENIETCMLYLIAMCGEVIFSHLIFI